MAKNNNLTDFLTDVANAIRAKKGITGKINPQNFASEISSIVTGGGDSGESGGGNAGGGSTGGGTVVRNVLSKDVNFYDYEGTLLYSYTKAEFMALSEMPELPTQEGLICQGWNYTLADAQDCVSVSNFVEIGAMYITDDGKTRLYIRFEDRAKLQAQLYFVQTVSEGVTIDWGDGTDTVKISGTGNKSTTHTYGDIGNYMITLEVKSGCTLTLGQKNSSYNIMGSAANNYRFMSNRLYKVEIGSGVTAIDAYAFTQCHSLKTISLPQTIKTIGNYAFYYNYGLVHITIPQLVTSLGSYCFEYSYSLKSVAIPKSLTSLGTYCFAYCGSLRIITLPYTLTTLGTYMCAYAYALVRVTLPIVVAAMPTYVFRNAYSMTYIKIPAAFTSIGNYAFNQAYGLAVVDFRDHTQVATISNTNSFTNTASDVKFVVPDELYDTWTTTSVWTNLASKIVKASEFTM